MTYSFDVFDTCLVRACDRPEFVFDLLAKRICGENTSTMRLMDFAMIRRNAEKLARKKYISNSIEEVTIEQIYEFCDFSPVLSTFDNSYILACELEIEREILSPVKSMLDYISDKRESGNKIIYISDMYVSKSFLISVLTEKGFFKNGDSLYVSSESGKTKYTGNLYKFVKDIERIRFEDWIHCGDNNYSDYKVPKELGIKSKCINHNYTRYEKYLHSLDYTSSEMSNMMMAAIAKTIRLKYDKTPELYYAADFIAPSYVPFVFLIMQDATSRGINNLYFLARDGLIFYKIAERYRDFFPNIGIHYLYVSRKALYLPSIDEINIDTISSRFMNVDSCTLEDVLDRLQMSSDGLLFKDYENKKGKQLIDSLLNNKDFIRKLNEKIQEQRTLCLEYLKSEGVTNGCCAIVDLSGTRKCHIAINQILKSDSKPSVFGYYYDVDRVRIPGNDYYSLLFADRYDYNNLNINKLFQLVYEQYFSVTPMDSTSYYKRDSNKVIPVFDKDTMDFDRRKRVFDLNVKICLDFANYFLSLIDKKKSEEVAMKALSTHNYFINVPEYFYLKALDGFSFSWSVVREEMLLQPLSFYNLLRSRHKIWFKGNLINKTPFKSFVTFLFELLYYYRKSRK